MYLVTIKRCEKDNPVTKRARYRVMDILPAGIWSEGMKQGVLSRNSTFKHATLLSNNPHKVGTFINPRKAIGL